MRGQAFVTFPSTELAHHALVCFSCNAFPIYILSENLPEPVSNASKFFFEGFESCSISLSS